jgi:hypothetical protein
LLADKDHLGCPFEGQRAAGGVYMPKKLAVVALIATFFLPACSKSNIEQITGTATSTTEQTKEATQIVEEGKKEKEDTYLSKIKSCWGWTWQNKEYIAGGAVAVVVIGLIAWGATIIAWGATRGAPAPKT